MALTNNLTTNGELAFRATTLGKFHSMAHAATYNMGFDPSSVNADRAVPIQSNENAVFAFLNNLATVTGANYSVSTVGSATCVYFKNFFANSGSIKVLRRTATETFLKTVQNASGTNVIAVNGPLFEFASGKSYQSTPNPVSDVIDIGKVYSSGSALGGTRDSSLGYKLQFSGGAFSWGQGDAAAGEGIGGLTPILLYQSAYSRVWKFGDSNVYDSSLPSNANAPAAGDPGAYANHIVQRSNNQYKGQNGYSNIGKNIFAYHPGQDAVVVLTQPQPSKIAVWSGEYLDFYRDWLFNKGFQYAVGFDGSNSVMLYEYKTKKFHVTPAVPKYNAMKTGILVL